MIALNSPALYYCFLVGEKKRGGQAAKRRSWGKKRREITMMPMHFFFSDKVILLFDFWDVHSAGGMVLSVFVIMLLTVLYEGIKVGKAKLIQHSQTAVAPSISQENLREGVSVNSDGGSATTSLKKRLSWHLAETLLHMVQVFLGYLVMLAVMTYNTWIFLGVIAGSAIGYFVAYPLLCLR